MVKDHLDSERGNPLLPHGVLFSVSRQENTYHGFCYNSHRRKEGNVLFNNALNTFYLRLYCIRHIIVKDHSDSERGNPLLPHGVLFPNSSRVSSQPG